MPIPEERITNVDLPPGYTQVCVWPGTVVGEDQLEEFKQFLLDEMGCRVEYLETIETVADGVVGGGEGGRLDIFLAIHDDDVAGFSVQRFALGIRWIEDVLSEVNYTSPIYPTRVYHYRSW